ncbi:MAG: hypothetical protein ChlgKO_04640 [Chlamydiales bacterium]
MKKRLTLLILVFSFTASEACESPYQEIFHSVVETQLQNFPYVDVENPSLIIAFSGTPGMGKTTITKRLEEEFHGIRISSDDLRNELRTHGLDPDKRPPYMPISHLQSCSTLLFQALSLKSPNHLFILDKSIDRTFPFFKQLQTPLFTIRLELGREEIENRIRESKKNPEAYLIHLDKWLADYNALENEEFSFTVDASQPVDKIISQLVLAIQNELAKNTLKPCES